MNTLNWKLILEIIGGVLFVALLVWFFFFRSPGLEPAATTPQQTFGQADTRTNVPAANRGQGGGASQTIQSPVSNQKVFKISEGPVAGATFMQDGRPTTTVARFVMQQNGHVLDLAIDSPGSVSRAVSNTTIPGAQQVAWGIQQVASRQVAATAVLQYVDSQTVKSVALIFPSATTSTSTALSPVRIQFLPDNLRSVATSPDGLSLAYIAATANGSDGYVARADGTTPRKLFSLPLSQVTMSWPSAGVLLVASKAAMGVPGIAFNVNASTGAITPILYTTGLSVAADPSFSKVVYQSVTTDDRLTYSHDTKSNLDRPLSFDPIPEKCIWSRLEAAMMYCAVPLAYTGPQYVDLWHQGAASAADSVVAYDLLTGETTILATPGEQDGGVASDIMQMALSADENYLLFVNKGDRSLWGVRLRDL